MDVMLPADLESKLAQLAASQGRETSSLVVEAVERLLSYDEWFMAEVENGLADLESGRIISHAEAGLRLERRLASGRSA